MPTLLDDLLLAKYRPDQARDERGRFADEGGGRGRGGGGGTGRTKQERHRERQRAAAEGRKPASWAQLQRPGKDTKPKAKPKAGKPKAPTKPRTTAATPWYETAITGKPKKPSGPPPLAGSTGKPIPGLPTPQPASGRKAPWDTGTQLDRLFDAYEAADRRATSLRQQISDAEDRLRDMDAKLDAPTNRPGSFTRFKLEQDANELESKIRGMRYKLSETLAAQSSAKYEADKLMGKRAGKLAKRLVQLDSRLRAGNLPLMLPPRVVAARS
jgi:hypothetical protein